MSAASRHRRNRADEQVGNRGPRGCADGIEQVLGGRGGRHGVRGDSRGAREGRGREDRGFRHLQDAQQSCADGPQPAKRRERADRGLEVTVVQGG